MELNAGRKPLISTDLFVPVTYSPTVAELRSKTKYWNGSVKLKTDCKSVEHDLKGSLDVCKCSII